VGNSHKALAVQWGDSNTVYYLRSVAEGPGDRTCELWQIDTDGTAETNVYDDQFQCWKMGTESFHLDREAGRVHLSSFVDPWESSIVSGSTESNTIDTVMLTDPHYRDHYSPAISPDGASVAYCADLTNDTEAGLHRLYVGPAGGGTGRRLSDVFCGNPSWSPDGTWVAYTLAGASTWGLASYVGEIWRVGTNGTGGVPLTRGLPVGPGCAFPTVYAAPSPFMITGIETENSDVVVTWQAAEGPTYTLQSAASFADGAWTNVSGHTTQAGVNGLMRGTATVDSASRVIYRVVGADSGGP
jgi:Tol biopolymer transport system component